MQRRNVYLVGPMGAGKSTVGHCLAEALGRPFHDLDQTLEQRTGVEVARIFELEQEAGFRRREADLLRELAGLDEIVLATGGGTVLLEENRCILRCHGLVIYLRTPVDLQLKRLAQDKSRPLLQADDRQQRLEALALERNPLYEDCADLALDSRPVGAHRMADEILALIRDSL